MVYLHPNVNGHSIPREAVPPPLCVKRGSLRRREWLAGSAAVVAVGRPAFSTTASVRLGVVQFGTVQWVADVIRRHALDSSRGFALQTVNLADTGAGRIGLMAGGVDIAMLDWMFVASQRAAGTKLCFVPFTSATGGVMVRDAAPIRSLADLAHCRLGVAGGPVDKSWLIIRAAAKATTGFDLTETANLVYGAPPLLNAKLMQNELDAVVTFWNFAARLETMGCRQVVSVNQCAQALGLPADMCLLGFVFHEDWAKQNPAAMNAFLEAVAAAENLLAASDVEWQQIRPMMNAPDDALFEGFRQRFLGGIKHPSVAAQATAAQKLFEVLLRTGGTRGADGVEQLPAGIFWRGPND